MTKIKVTVPDFLSIKNYNKLTNIEHLSDFNKLIKSISIISDLDEEEIKKWKAGSITEVYSGVIECLNLKEQFFPIFELDGQLYGFRQFKDLTLGEYIDLETLCKDPNKNLSKIMAVLYRPVIKHRFNDWKFKLVHNVRLLTKQVDNIFNHYDIEEYDVKKRDINAEALEEVPAQFALGALAFFLGLGNLFLTTTLPYSTKKEKVMQRIMTEENLTALGLIGDGLAQFIHSPNQVYSVSQEQKVLLN